MTLMEKLGKEFVVTTELGPVKGALFQDAVEKAKAYRAIDGINLHDCPMGNLRINASMMGSIVQQELQIPAIPHFTCRDRSLLGMQADLLGAHALGIRHILATTGDPPKHGPFGETSKAVFNCSTLDLIRLIKNMNRGLDANGKEFGGKTEFAVSCTAVPVARDLDRELAKMGRKIEAGADFFQTQVVYDAEKAVRFAEKAKSLGKPVLMGIMPLKSMKMANYMKDHVDGIEVPDAVIARMADGMSGIDICCDIIRQVHSHFDGIHIMAMGDVAGTNTLAEFSRSLNG